MKVYGGTFDGVHRMIVAASSMKAAATAFGVAYGQARTYGCETGNAEEIATASSDPGRVFSRRVTTMCGPWVAVEPKRAR